MLRRAALLSAALMLLAGLPSMAVAEDPPSPSPSAPLAPAPASPSVPGAPLAPSVPAVPPAAGGDAAVSGDKDAPDDLGMPEVFYGEDKLPEKVRDMRRRIMAATRTGDLQALRPVIESNEMPPALSGGDNDDPIATLKLLSGDDKGQEILAILQEILDAGYVHVDVGTPQDMYVWPYFARFKLDKLSPTQMVELFRIITAGDLEDMRDKGVYSFYRVGIGPDGTWHYFEDGD